MKKFARPSENQVSAERILRTVGDLPPRGRRCVDELPKLTNIQ